MITNFFLNGIGQAKPFDTPFEITIPDEVEQIEFEVIGGRGGDGAAIPAPTGGGVWEVMEVVLEV